MIKDYLHYYKGASFQHTDDFCALSFHTLIGYYIDRWNENCKLILRPLSDMTEEEAIGMAIARGYKREQITNLKFVGLGFEFGDESGGTFLATSGPYMNHKPKEFHYLLSRGFDLFGLIEEGVVLDKTKMT